MTIYIIMGLGFAIALAVSGFMVLVGIGDKPGARSSHSEVTPTGGGLGIIATLGLVSLFLSQNSGLLVGLNIELTPKFAQVLSLIWAVGVLGFMDDILDLSAVFKFAFLLFISIAAVWAVGPVTSLPFGGAWATLPDWFAWGGSILWVFVVINIVNFMDGSNGLMLVVMGLASFFMAYVALSVGAAEPFLMLLILFSGIVGLAVYNFRRRAMIFAGDVGSLSVGLTYAVCVLWICSNSELNSPVYIGPVLILPFLADAFFTIMRRARNKEKLMQAHRTHLYQRMIKGGQSHMAVAFYYGLSVVALIYYSQWAMEGGFHQYINYPILPFLCLSSVYMLVGRKFR